MAFFSLPCRLYRSGRLSQYLLLLACLAGVTGLLCSRALVALSPVAGALAAFAQPDFRSQLVQWSRMRTVWFPALLYGFLLLSGLYTITVPVWRHEIFRQLPLLGVPLAFAVAVPLVRWQRVLVGSAFVVGVAAVGVATLGQYLQHPQLSDAAFGMGQNMPAITGVFHIHFSIMLALAVFFGILLSREAGLPGWLRWLLRLASVAAVVVLHVLAYRTGLLLLYATLLLDVVLLLLASRRRWLAGVLVVLILGLPWLALHTLESVQQRWDATHYDLEQFSLGHDINDYSLAKRLAAWHTAVAVFRTSPAWGVAPADVMRAMQQQYARYSYGLRPENRIMVHNQYLHAAVGGGVVQLSLLLLLLLGPFRQPAQRRNFYTVHYIWIIGVGMLTDSLLELQIGFNLFVFLYGFLVVATERKTAAVVRNTTMGSPV